MLTSADRRAIFRDVAAARKRFYQDVTWDDGHRHVGSAFGRFITDATLKDASPDCPHPYLGVFRAASNMADQYVNVPAREFNLIAREGADGPKRIVPVSTYIQQLATFNAGRTGEVKSFPDFADDTVIRVRYQVAIVLDGTTYTMASRAYRDGQSLVIAGNTQATTTHMAGKAYEWTTAGAIHGDNDEFPFHVTGTEFKDVHHQEERGEARAKALAAGLATSNAVGPANDPESLNTHFALYVALENAADIRRRRAAMAVKESASSKWSTRGKGSASKSKTCNFGAAAGAGAWGAGGLGDCEDDDDGDCILESCAVACTAPSAPPTACGAPPMAPPMAPAAASAAPPTACVAPPKDVAVAGRVSIARTAIGKARPLRLNNDFQLDKTVDATATVTRVIVIPADATRDQIAAAANKALDLLDAVFKPRPTTSLRDDIVASVVPKVTILPDGTPLVETVDAGLTEDIVMG